MNSSIIGALLGLFLFIPALFSQSRVEVLPDPEKEKRDELIINKPEVESSEHFWGNKDAKVVVTVYADFQCPACKSFYEKTETKLKQNDSDKIKFVFKHYPLNSIHKQAFIAAEAAEAAGAQGKFWEYHDLLFKNQSQASSWNVNTLESYAKELNLDTKKFREDLEGYKYRSKVLKDQTEAISKGYPGTPTILINGKVYDEVFNDYESIKVEINKYLR